MRFLLEAGVLHVYGQLVYDMFAASGCEHHRKDSGMRDNYPENVIYAGLIIQKMMEM